MAFRKLLLASLIVNPANDRHGELKNETAAIAQLFPAQEPHMRNLAKDLVAKGEIFELPLVFSAPWRLSPQVKAVARARQPPAWAAAQAASAARARLRHRPAKARR